MRRLPAGLVSVRKNVGGGSFLAGYKRHFADYSSLEVRPANAGAHAATQPARAHSRCIKFNFNNTTTLGRWGSTLPM